MNEQRKALITGGAGFIGSHLAELLLRDGWEVFALDDLSTGSERNIAHLRERPWVCASPRRGANEEDVEFWVRRRGWERGVTKDGRRIYGEGLEDAKAYFPG